MKIIFCLFITLVYCNSVHASPISLHIAAGTPDVGNGFWVPVSSVIEEHVRSSDQYIFRETETGLELLVEKNNYDVYRSDITTIWPMAREKAILLFVSDPALPKLSKLKRQNIGNVLVLVLEGKVILLHKIVRDTDIGSIDIKTGVALPEAVDLINEYINRTGDPVNIVGPVVDHKTYYIDLRYLFLPFVILALAVFFFNRKKIFRFARR